MINIVVPMAGRGERFVVTGERTPKPLIAVPQGKSMIEHVIEFLSLRGSYSLIFVCLAEHETLHGIGSRLRTRVRDCEIFSYAAIMCGPSDTVLLAATFVDNADELLVAYCDSFLTIDVNDFIAHCRGRTADGGIIVYPSSNPSDSRRVRCRNDRASNGGKAGDQCSWHGRILLFPARRGLRRRDRRLRPKAGWTRNCSFARCTTSSSAAASG